MTRGSGDLSLTAEPNDRNNVGISPSHSPRYQRSRANSNVGPSSSSPATPSFTQLAPNTGRHVRFSGQPAETSSNVHSDDLPPSSPSSTSNPSRRIGNVRDFRLHLPETKDSAGDVLDMELTDSDPSDAESDGSGKVGEKRVSPVEGGQGNQQPGFFTRLRRASRTSFGAANATSSASTTPNETDENGKGKRKASSPEEEERSYKLKLRDQQASQASNPDGISNLDELDSNLHSTQNLKNSIPQTDSPSSPELQVPLMEEPPLVGNQIVSSPAVHFFSQRSKKYNGPGIVSPYNSGNPFWGYPAIVPNSNANSKTINASNQLGLSIQQQPNTKTYTHSNLHPNSTPRQLHHRRRKRDLIRTLSYLFVLRFLAFHRHLRWRFILIWKEIFKTLKIGGQVDGEGGGDGVDSRWRIIEERHRLSRSKSLRNRNPVGFGMDPTTYLSSTRRDAKRSFSAFWKGWTLLFLICLALRPKMRRSLTTTLVRIVGSLNGRGKKDGENLDVGVGSFAMLIDGMLMGNRRVSGNSNSLTGLRVRERLLGM